MYISFYVSGNKSVHNISIIHQSSVVVLRTTVCALILLLMELARRQTGYLVTSIWQTFSSNEPTNFKKMLSVVNLSF